MSSTPDNQEASEASKDTNPSKGKKEIHPKLTPSEREHRLKVLSLWVPQCFSLAKHGFTCLCVASLGLFAWLSVREMAGRVTFFEAIANLSERTRLSEAILVLATGLSSAGWFRAHKSIKTLRKENLPRLANMESLLDQERTSSGLNEFGESPPGDVT